MVGLWAGKMVIKEDSSYIDQWETCAEKWQMKLNLDKCGVMYLGGQMQEENKQ